MRTLRTEGDEGFTQQDERTTRLIEKYNILQKERDELEARLEKEKIASETEISIERKQHEKTVLELAKAKHENRELIKQVSHLENRLQLKEKEIDDLKSRLEMKNVFDQKHSNREAAIFQNFIGKSPTHSNAYDVKVMSFIKVYQDQKEHLEEENRNLKREVEKLRNDLFKSEEEGEKLQKGFDQTFDQRSKETANRIDILEAENKDFIKDNQLLREKLEKFENERHSLKEENAELKKRYEELRNKYYAIDVGTPNKAEPRFGANLTPQAGTMKVTKSFTTSKKPDMKTTDREGKFYMTRQQTADFEISSSDSKRLISEIMDIYNLQTPAQILTSIKKTEKVMQAIPKLQRLLSEIANIVFSRTENQVAEPQLELIIPSLKNWVAQMEETKELEKMKAILIEKIGLVKDSEVADIIKSVDDLLYISFQHQDMRMKTQKESGDNAEHKMIVDQLTKILGSKPTVPQMKQMMVQLSDLRHFITLVKTKLDLDPNMSNEACLTRLLKYMENSKKDGYIISILQRILDCNYDHIIDEVENLISLRNNTQRNPLAYTYQKPY